VEFHGIQQKKANNNGGWGPDAELGPAIMPFPGIVIIINPTTKIHLTCSPGEANMAK
jgi:hypothetical protein